MIGILFLTVAFCQQPGRQERIRNHRWICNEPAPPNREDEAWKPRYLRAILSAPATPTVFANLEDCLTSARRRAQAGEASIALTGDGDRKDRSGEAHRIYRLLVSVPLVDNQVLRQKCVEPRLTALDIAPNVVFRHA